MADWYGGLSGGQIHVQAYESSYDINGNYSIVQINVWIERTSGSGKYSNYTDNSWIDYIDGGGFQAGSGTYDLRGGGSQLLLSGAAVVYHNADGTRTVGISGSFNDPHGNLGSNSAGGSLGLTTIPRATQPTVSPTSGQTDANYVVGFAGASTSFSHDLYYSLNGGTSYTLLASALAYNGTYTWTPASSLLPSSTDVTAILLLRTKSGATTIGDKTVSLPLHVPDTIVPVVSSVSWADAQTSSPDIPTMMGGAGRYVQGWSKLLPTAVSVGASGSTVTACKITVNAQVTDSGSAFGAAVGLSGSVPFSAQATDTRGRVSVPLTGTVGVTAYNFPNLASFTVTRTSDAAGTLPSPTGTYLSIVPTASVSDLTFGGVQKNLLEYQIEIAPKLTGVFTVVSAWGSSGVSGNTWTGQRVFGTYASSSEWIVRITIRDVFGKNGYNTSNTVTAKSLNIPSEAVFMDWDQGVGIGLGKYHSQGIFDVKGDVYVDGVLSLSAGHKGVQNGTKTLLDVDDLAALNAADVRYGYVTGITSSGVQVLLSDGITTVSCISVYQPSYVPRVADSVSVQLIAGTYWTILGRRVSATYVSAKPSYSANYQPYETPAAEWNSDPLGPWSDIEATRTINGIVMVTGMVARISGNFTLNDTICTLPVGFRPEYTCYFLCNTSAGYARVQVDTDGTVRLASAGVSASGAWLALGRIMFPLGLTWTNLTLASGNSAVTTVTSGATNIGTTVVGPWPAAPGYAKDANGIVWFRGGVKYSSAPSDGTVIATMPTGYGPGGGSTRARQHHQICVSLGSSSIFAEVGIGSSVVNRDRVYKVGSQTSANAVGISLDGIPYASESSLPTGAQSLGIDGMTDYNNAAQWNPELYVYPDGFCYTSGLNGGVSGIIGQLTDLARSRGRFMITTDCNNLPASVNIRANGTYSVFGTTAGPLWVSVDTAWMADPSKVGDLNARG